MLGSWLHGPARRLVEAVPQSPRPLAATLPSAGQPLSLTRLELALGVALGVEHLESHGVRTDVLSLAACIVGQQDAPGEGARSVAANTVVVSASSLLAAASGDGGAPSGPRAGSGTGSGLQLTVSAIIALGLRQPSSTENLRDAAAEAAAPALAPAGPPSTSELSRLEEICCVQPPPIPSEMVTALLDAIDSIKLENRWSKTRVGLSTLRCAASCRW